MTKYEIVFAASAARELSKLPSKLLARLLSRVEALEIDPRPSHGKKLHGGGNEWRIRAGDYRVVYTIDDRKKLVEITRIRRRDEVYNR